MGAGSASAAARTAQPGFTLPGSGGPGSTPPLARATSVSALASLDALIALQQTDGPLDRRRRAVRRAGRLLDVLDGLKLALLDGAAVGPQLRRLTQAIDEARETTGEPGLEGLLDQIEARAAVELAKLEVAALA